MNIKRMHKKALSALTLTLSLFAGGAYSIDELNQFTPVINYQTGEVVSGAFSQLTREEDRVCYSIDTHSLPAGTYTNWWVLYNFPENCSNPGAIGGLRCGNGDMPNPDVSVTVMWANSGVVGQTGRTNFSSCVSVGENTHVILPFGNDRGLLNPLGAEVQLVVRYHGPAKSDNAEALGAQLNSFLGGCTDESTGVVDFDCFDPQMVFHKSPTQ